MWIMKFKYQRNGLRDSRSNSRKTLVIYILIIINNSPLIIHHSSLKIYHSPMLKWYKKLNAQGTAASHVNNELTAKSNKLKVLLLLALVFIDEVELRALRLVLENDLRLVEETPTLISKRRDASNARLWESRRMATWRFCCSQKWSWDCLLLLLLLLLFEVESAAVLTSSRGFWSNRVNLWITPPWTW